MKGSEQRLHSESSSVTLESGATHNLADAKRAEGVCMLLYDVAITSQ